MSDECSCNGTSCSDDCEQECDQSREEKIDHDDFRVELNQLSHVRHVIGIVSGKGGVGKSLVTSLLATLFSRKGYKTAVLDADITGPSIPKIFGVTGKAEGSELGIFPKLTHGNISIMSINLLLESEDAPVIWRGPLIAGTVKQFWTDVVWHDIDYMFIDMPPGTGDVPLTVFQSLPVDGIVVVTSPQDLVSMIVKKAANMAKMMNISVLGIVENMSYYNCPDCGKKEEIFGRSKLPEVAADMKLEILGRIPIDSKLALLCDEGTIEKVDIDYLNHAVETIENKYPICEE
jgi:Mrp family chromosome partitioning ATPase